MINFVVGNLAVMFLKLAIIFRLKRGMGGGGGGGGGLDQSLRSALSM